MYCPDRPTMPTLHDLSLMASFFMILSNLITGLEPAEEHCNETCERCITSEYADTGQCDVSDDEERDSFCELYCQPVCGAPSLSNLRD